MTGLKEQFLRFYMPDDDETGKALHAGLVAVDTNVLLSLYRFQSEARDELFRVLDNLGDRLWIPYQVALEFHQRRLSVIAEQEDFFGKVRADLDASAKDYLGKFKAFCNRIAMPEVNARRVVQRIQGAHQAACSEVSRAEKENQVHLDNRDSDEILARLETLFSGKVGEPMETAQLDETRKEAKRRIDARIPPGYMDRGKTDPFGDYIIWVQLKREATKRHIPTVFVTDDRKEDWFRREHGLTLGPRTQLCEEMEVEAGVRLLMMTTETFLIQAKTHLGASVSPTTVDQAKGLPEDRAREDLLVQAALKDRLNMLQAQRDHVEALTVRTMSRRGFVESEINRVMQARDSSGQVDSLDDELKSLLGQREILRDEGQMYEFERAKLNEEIADLQAHYRAIPKE